MKSLCFFLALLTSVAMAQQVDPSEVPASDSKGVTRVQMLARVGASSVSTRSLFLFTCVKVPAHCQSYEKFVSGDTGRELQEYLLVKMAFEDNSIFKTVRFSDAELTKKVNDFEKRNSKVWAKLKATLQVQEVELRSVIEETLIFQALLSKQDSLESWIQQLRSRFKVQMFNQNAT